MAGRATSVIERAADRANELEERLALLRASASSYVCGEDHLKRCRQWRGNVPGHDRRVWKEMAELGWLGVLLPERFGGQGLDCREVAVIAEALGRALFPEPLVPAAILAGGTLVHGDNDELKSALLPALASGEMVPALAWHEDGPGADPLAVKTRAEETSGGVRLFGIKRLVIGGAAADGFIVTARGREGIGLYWVPAGQAATRVSVTELADGRFASEIELCGSEVPDGRRVAGPGIAEAALLRAYDEALIATAAELLGVLSAAFDITLDHLRTRTQFGKPIGSFQALQHRMVDLYIEQRMCRHAMDDVVARVCTPGSRADARGALASRIKARCSEAGLRITREAIQMHGAMGFADECDIGMFLKRAIVLAGWLGGADVHRRRFARLAPHDAEARASTGEE